VSSEEPALVVAMGEEEEERTRTDGNTNDNKTNFEWKYMVVCVKVLFDEEGTHFR
jgi:hypothetical protein